MSRRRVIGGVALGLVAGLAIGVPLGRWVTSPRRTPVTTAGVFQDVLTAIRRSFVDSLSDDELYVKAAKGVVSTLGDPYSSFLSPEEFRRYRDLLTGSGASLGLAVEDGLTGVRVAAVYPGSGADRAGVAAGQYLLEVDGRPAAGLTAARIRGLLRADSGAVTLRFRTPGDSVPVELVLEPGATRYPAVGAAVRLDGRVGYVALRALSDQSARQLRATLSRLDADRLDGLILDLRGNPGGRLDEGLNVAELFLEPGQRIGAVTKRNEFPALYAARTPQPYPALRLAVLVDRQTASSAEIVAAALRDHRRAVLVGERTFGKGLIQTTIPLGDSVAVRLSTGRWQRPNGSPLAQGLVPDSTVEPSAARPLAAALREQGPALAAELEALARTRVEGRGRDTALADADLARLEAAARRLGVPLGEEGLRSVRDALALEVRRLAALLARDREGAERAALLADDVVRAGLALLRTPAPAAPDSAGR